MSTLDFLRRIIPRKGFKILGVARPAPYKGLVHHLFDSVEDMAETAVEWSDEGRTVYHACASFAEPSVTVRRRNKKTGEMEDAQAVRVQDNAAFCRSFWADLDVGEGKPYATQKEAAKAVLSACQKAELPRPMLVSSGYGVHAYWPLTADIEAATWNKVASRLKALFAKLDLHADPSRTADVASVLRPAGCMNYKNENDPRAVRVFLDSPDTAPADFIKALVAAIKRFGVDVVDKPKVNINSDLMQVVEYPPSSAHKIVEKCQAMRHFQTVMGAVEEPFWRAALGVIKHTVEGDDLAHEWSQGHEGYDRYETQEKLDRWAAGPATCATFECFGQCDGCPVKGKVKSPIQLGVQLPEQATAPVERRVDAVAKSERLGVPAERESPQAGVEEVVAEEAPRAFPKLPEGLSSTYRFNGRVLLTMIEDDDGVPQPVTICREFIYPLEIYRSSGDARQASQAMLRATRYTPSAVPEEINIPMQAIAIGNRELASFFGSIGVVVDNIIHMRSYLNSFINNLRETTDDSLAADRMGWNDNDFLLGQTRYSKQGSTKAVLSSALKEYQASFSTKGSLEGWVEAIDKAYNRPGQEQYQFMVLCGFAAPLVKFVGDYRGVLVSAVSYQSGQGKTTAQNAAISIYGDPGKLSTAHKRGTVNALFERLGAMGTLPFAIDEVSNIDSKELSDLAYAISQGVQKDRLNKAGGLRAQREPWQTLVLTSGNRSLISTLAADGAAREPEMRRVFELTFNTCSDLSKADADEIFAELSRHHGHAGLVYAEFLARNQEAVQALVTKALRSVNEKFALRREERFWGVALASVLAGHALAAKLGLVRFDRAAVVAYMGQALTELRHSVRHALGTEEDLLAALMADVGFDCYVTENVGELRGGAQRAALVMREPRRAPKLAGRVVRENNELWLRPEYVRQWCSEKRADMRHVKQLLVNLGAIKDINEGKNLMRGIPGAAPVKSRYWEVDMTKLGGLEVEVVEEPKVVPIRR